MLILEDEDAKEFWDNIKNPKISKEVINFFKEIVEYYGNTC